MKELTPQLRQTLADIAASDHELTRRYADRMEVNTGLGRRVVSFQADKSATESRWFKYREGFSLPLMTYLFGQVRLAQGPLLDPFAGSGTALFAAADAERDALGVELLPSSAEVVEVRRLARTLDPAGARDALLRFASARPWDTPGGPTLPFPHIKITAGAFPEETEQALGRYRHETEQHPDPNLRRLLQFAALCVLEAISYTRKDGQYLRWDARSGRRAGKKPFDKGRILPFTEAVIGKLREIAGDLTELTSEARNAPAPTLFDWTERNPAARAVPGVVRLIPGSCLDVLPTLEADSFGGIVTSPPYANRYDYTRTYALELAMLGVGEEEIRRLRQAMLSCTVENREKEWLGGRFAPATGAAAERAFAGQESLQKILAYLEDCRKAGVLNNAGIPRMLHGYFREMCYVIFECARLLRPGAPFVMVNDNVRYQGAHVPVDLILSDFAEAAGLTVERVWVLPTGKGNSSQQMGVHGRAEVRKCVYVWRKPEAGRLQTSEPLGEVM